MNEWYSTLRFAELANISRQKAHRALRRAVGDSPKKWRGAQLIVRLVLGANREIIEVTKSSPPAFQPRSKCI